MVLVVLLIVLVDVSFSRAADTYYDIDAQFIGCYRWGIQEGWEYTRSGGMTIDLCTETCRRYMKTYAALQNGSVCRCSDDVIRHHPADDCHVACSGNPQQYCGGLKGSMSVYASCPIGFYGESCLLDCNCLNRTQCNIRTGDCPNGCEPDWSGSKCDTSSGEFSISPTYMGCWKDNQQNIRDFESENFHSQATVETCSVFCRRKKYTYMGLQYYSECFCGNSFGKFGPSPEAECNQPCHQNRSQMCGGGNRNSVYAVCPIGFFGDACTQACHCTKGVRCFVANGTCMSRGCAQGWNGQACNIKDHSCSKGVACKPDETCKMYDLKFTQVSRCECREGYVRPGTWSTCIGLEECRKRKDCNSMLNINSTEIDDDPGTIPLAQPLKENAVDYDAGSPAESGYKYFTPLNFCAALDANKIVSLSQVISSNLNNGVSGDVFCTWECIKDPMCRHFNYKSVTQSCEMFYNDQSSFVLEPNCRFFQNKDSVVASSTVNLALNKLAVQSTTWYDPTLQYSAAASLSVDGNKDSVFTHKSCSATNDGPGGANWWVVDLGREYDIHHVVMSNRVDMPPGNRQDRFIVGVSRCSPTECPPVRGSYPVCGQYGTTATAGGTMAVFCNQKSTGRYVIVQQPSDGFGWLNFCELEVYANHA